MDNLWFFAVAGGPIILGGAILYALMKNRRLSRGEKRQQNEAIRELYGKDDKRT